MLDICKFGFRQLEQVGAVPSDSCCTQVGTIHQTDAVEDADSYDQATVDAVDDLLLLGRGELAFVVIVGGNGNVLLQGRGFLLDVVRLLLDIVVSHGG
jgi:hypothetical protein